MLDITPIVQFFYDLFIWANDFYESLNPTQYAAILILCALIMLIGLKAIYYRYLRLGVCYILSSHFLSQCKRLKNGYISREEIMRADELYLDHIRMRSTFYAIFHLLYLDLSHFLLNENSYEIIKEWLLKNKLDDLLKGSRISAVKNKRSTKSIKK